MRSSRGCSHATSTLLLVLALGCSSESGSGNAAENGGASGQTAVVGSTGTAGSTVAGGTIGSGGTGTGSGATLGGSGSTGRGGSTDGGTGGVVGSVSGGAAGSVSGGAGGAPDGSGAIYLATNGADTNPGTMSQPLKTVTKARDLVRAMTASMSADITVYVRGGTYTVPHNAMVNAPTNVVRNQNGMDTITDTPAAKPSSVMSMAGIEAAYADIKKATIPAAAFRRSRPEDA